MDAKTRDAGIYLAAAVLLLAAGFVVFRSGRSASAPAPGSTEVPESPPASTSPSGDRTDGSSSLAREAREKLGEAKIHYQAFLASERAQDAPSRARHYKHACRVLDELIQTLQVLPADKGEVGPILGEATQLRADLAKKGYTEDG